MAHQRGDLEHSVISTGVSEFYNGKNIFLTGGSGFIGKVIIEKLLRCCPGIKNLFMMIRPKKGKSIEERIQSLFKLPLFDRLNCESPDAWKKITPIAGDIVQNQLGLSEDDRKTIQENVDVVIHSAATVRFDEPLRIAMEMNVFAVKEIIRLCHEIKHLKVFCHISTAYSQCNLPADQAISENFYNMDTHHRKIIDIIEWMSDDMLAKITKPLLKNYPNTYTFTKAIAELVLKEEAEGLPLLIVRPSIVSASIADPVAGWIDNYNGISGMVAAAGKGVLRTLLVDPKKRNDIVPVDLVVKCIVSSVWYYGVSRMKEPLIINCTSSNVNPTMFVQMQTPVVSMLEKYPYNSIVRRPNFSFSGNSLFHRYWMVVSHYLPAIIADGLSVLIGKQPKFMRAYQSLHKSLDVLDFFILNEWTWSNDNFNQVLKALPECDKEAFNFDMRVIDWAEYYKSLALGVKLYLVKDNLSDLPKAFRLKQRYKLVRWMSSTILTLVACRYFFLKSARFRRLWFEVLFAIYRFLRYFSIANVSM